MTLFNRMLYAFIAGTIFVCAARAADLPVPSTDAPAPPLASMAVVQCGKPVVIWVILANGHTFRFDKDHKPATDADTKKFLAWLDTGPSDIYTVPCTVST